jgi:hypothetical protein
MSTIYNAVPCDERNAVMELIRDAAQRASKILRETIASTVRKYNHFLEAPARA